VGPYNRPLQPTAIVSRDQPAAGGAAAERPIRYTAESPATVTGRKQGVQV
jgi:hypothetical protein